MTAESVAVPAELRPKLDQAVRRIVEVANPQTVILFGSWAEGEQHEGSDVDLLVVAETSSWHKLSVTLRKALRPVLAPLSFDLLVYPPENWEADRRLAGFVAREADRKGVRLYESA